MKRQIIWLCFAVLIGSCETDHDDNSETFDFNNKTGELTLSYENLSKWNTQLKKIIIQSHSDLHSQEIILDSNLIVNDVITYKNVFWKDNFKNNWIAFDRQGNLNFNDSYFYETFLDYKDGSLVIECTFQNHVGNVQYLLHGDLDENYKFKGKIDTSYFNPDNSAFFIDPNAKNGTNFVRFIIVDEDNSGKEVKQRKIYGAKEYVLIKE